ncbi:MAG: M23 family metallopeptidase [Saprospiraceae bacterium]|nr:M23 family metallopeptidase [Saprospiraceae bacterium]
MLFCQTMDVNIFDEPQPNGDVVIKADNHEFFHVSVELKLDLKGVKTSHKSSDILVVQPRTEGQILVTLSPIPGKSWSYRSSFKAHFGNVNLTQYDSSFLYELPFEPRTQEIVSQGYFGQLSHQNEYAIDFDMDSGTAVHAARGGQVVQVVDIHNKSCPDASCTQYNNYVLVEHDDGSYADYAHLRKNGAVVNPGQTIEQGELIGYSGNTGWTTGPHLHFSVFIPSINKRKSIPVLFNIGNGQGAQLEEGKMYQRN